jgi:F0F1-type ATP synthase assembly protein I
MGEFVLLALAYSSAPLILIVLLLLLLLLGAFFLALSVLLTAAFHQRSLPSVNWCIQTEPFFLFHCTHF